jgi:hypothetical protein
MAKDEGKIAVLVGTVTDDVRLYEVPKGMKVCALKFTETARARIIAAGGECMTFDQLATVSPTGTPSRPPSYPPQTTHTLPHGGEMHLDVGPARAPTWPCVVRPCVSSVVTTNHAGFAPHTGWKTTIAGCIRGRLGLAQATLRPQRACVGRSGGWSVSRAAAGARRGPHVGWLPPLWNERWRALWAAHCVVSGPRASPLPGIPLENRGKGLRARHAEFSAGDDERGGARVVRGAGRIAASLLPWPAGSQPRRTGWMGWGERLQPGGSSLTALGELLGSAGVVTQLGRGA